MVTPVVDDFPAMPIPLPPVILFAVASLALIWRVDSSRRSWTGILVYALTLLVAGGVLSGDVTAPPGEETRVRLERIWQTDSLTVIEQWVVLFFGLFSAGVVIEPMMTAKQRSRSYGYLLFLIAGLLLATTANDLLTLGLALEIVMLAFAALQDAWLRADRQSTINLTSTGDPRAELWPRWLLSAWFWLGVALLANATATTNLDQLRTTLIEAYMPGGNRPVIGAPSRLILLATGLIAMSLFARIGLAPFHLLQNTDAKQISQRNLLVTVAVGQLAGVIPLIRLFGDVLAGLSPALVVVSTVIATASFAFAGLKAVRGMSPGSQSMTELVRGLALLQSGWLLLGVMVITMELDHPATRWAAFAKQSESMSIVIFALIATLLGELGLAGVLQHLTRTDRQVEYLEDLKGLSRYAPIAALTLSVALASAVACPLTMGFWSRWLMLLSGNNIHLRATSGISTPHQGLRLTLFCGVLASIAMAALILRLMREIYAESPLAKPAPQGGRPALSTSLLASAMLVVLGMTPNLVLTPLGRVPGPRQRAPQEPERGSGRTPVSQIESHSDAPLVGLSPQ